MKLTHPLVAILFPFLLAGCAATPSRISYDEMAPRLSYQGFSFLKPASTGWFIVRDEEQPADVTLRRDLGSSTHTFYARVSLGALDRQPETAREFAKLARIKQTAPYPIRELSNAEQTVEIQGQWCIRTDNVSAVRTSADGPELRMVVTSYRCLHPAFPQVTLDFFYSERGLPSEISPALAADGEQFLRGVRIDMTPEIPAGTDQ